MTISIWRYCHLILAIFSSVILVIASVTGIILSFEPIVQSSHSVVSKNFAKISIGEAITSIQSNNEEIIFIEVTDENFVSASLLDINGNSGVYYINPEDGTKLGRTVEKAALFSFTTNLHRSLFLKGTGRISVGIISVLLIFITISGFFLLIKRHGGLRYLFTKVQKGYFQEYFHVVLSKWFIVPIIIIAASGAYLSAEKFSLLPEGSLKHNINYDSLDNKKKFSVRNLDIFKQIPLSQLNRLEFPFSTDEEDYFFVQLKDRELLIHQYTGEVLSEKKYPITALISDICLLLHTGRGNIIWSLVLLISCISILFFIYSGIFIFFKRTKKTKENNPVLSNKDDAEFIILVGSETGSTYNFGRQFCQALQMAGKSVFISDMNSYTSYQNATQIIFLVATYGNGDPTTNARNFERVFLKVNPTNKIRFSVLAFGSKEYPNYCSYGTKVQELIQKNNMFSSLMPMHKVNNQSKRDINYWVNQWKLATDTNLSFTLKDDDSSISNWTVITKSEINIDNTFILKLKPEYNAEFDSGDILKVHFSKVEKPRSYSIARFSTDVVISVKLHELGKCSSYLSKVSKGDQIESKIIKNPKFHFSKNSKKVVMIANGTGIAPFLGMIKENYFKTPIEVFWGCRSKESLEIYKPYLDQVGVELSDINLSFSSIDNGYIQDLVYTKEELILSTLKNNGTIMVCGSIEMQNSLLEYFDRLFETHLNNSVDHFIHRGQLQLDCY